MGHEHYMNDCPDNEFPELDAPKEPTLTCSEVVERLRRVVFESKSRQEFHEKAEKILHSWRERRVQELEEALRTIGTMYAVECQCDHSDDDCCSKIGVTCAWCISQRALANSEQIRKGAKHE